MVGGDGSLHAVVAALHRRHELASTVVGLIPLGTGNDFARGVGLPLDPEAAARVVVEGNIVPMDLIVDCLGGVVVNNVHIGVGALAAHNARPMKKVIGRLGYALGAVKAAINPPFIRDNGLFRRVAISGVGMVMRHPRSRNRRAPFALRSAIA